MEKETQEELEEIESVEDEIDSSDTTGEPVDEKPSLEEVNKNLISEIKEIRKERQEAKEALEALKAQADADREKEVKDSSVTPTNAEIITKTLEEILLKKDKQKAISNKEEAFNKFITNNKQFSEDNDPTGLKRDALKKKLSRFNTEGITKLEDFYSVIGDAYRLLGGNDTKSKTSEVANPYSSTPTVGITPTVVENSKLSSKEKEVAKRIGYTDEQMLKVKIEKPDFYKQIFKE